jgi:hypothetical protein
MNMARTILTLMLCGVFVAHGDHAVRVVHVGGDVPKPGPVRFEGKGMTIDSAMAGAGMDIRPFYAKENTDNNGLRSPIKVVVIRQREKTIYDPIVDSVTIQGLQLEPNDAIAIIDIRKHPERITARMQRVEKMLAIGSTEIADELLSLAMLQYEYDDWLGQSGAVTKGSDEHLKKEASRLVREGKGQKILDILELKVGALELDGLGPSHPKIKSIKSLIQIYRDLVAK